MKRSIYLRIAVLCFLSFMATVAIAQTTPNLALNQTVFASSVHDGSPEAAFDGDLNSTWQSDYSDPQWIYVDLGGSYPIRRVHIVWDTAYALNYDLQVSDDAFTWITVRSVVGNPSVDNDLGSINANGRYVRIYATARGNTSGPSVYGYFLKEMEVYTYDDAPAVSITSPGNNTQHLFTATPTLVATADAVAMNGSEIDRVELYSDNALVSLDTSAPYTFDLGGLDEGVHSLVAKAVDETNAVAYSTAVTVQFFAVTADPCNSDAWVSTTTYGNAGTLVTYVGRLYRNRYYTLAQDPLNNSGSYGPWELISTCSTPTIVNISSPEQNDSFYALAAIDIHVDAFATPPYRIAKVDLYNGSTLIDSDTTTSFTFDWNDVPAGTYSLTAVATDNAGVAVTSDAITVRVLAGTGCNAPEWRPNIVYEPVGEEVFYQGSVYQNKWYSYGQDPTANSGQYQVWTLVSTCPASATIISPDDSTIFVAPASIAINATATNPAGAITKVEFYEGPFVLAVDSTAPYAFDWTGVGPGAYVLVVKAYDAVGVIAISPSVNVQVNSFQDVFTWTGASASSDWNDPGNWSPNGIPGSGDSVVIGSSGNFPELLNSTTVHDLTMLNDSLDLNGQQLLVTGIARFAGGWISNGTLNVQCDDAWFTGTIFDTTVLLNVTCSNIYLNGSIFDGVSYITKQGSEAVDNDGTGSNTFNGSVTLTNNTSFRLRTSDVAGEDFNAAAIFDNRSTGVLEVGYNGITSFTGNITFSSNNEVSLGAGSGEIVAGGSNDQVLSKTGAADIVFNRLQVNKSTGSLIMDGQVYIDNSLTLANGRIISASGNQLIFRPGAVVNGASNSSFVAGPVTRYGSGSFIFPVGKGSIYRPIGIAPGGSDDEAFTAEYFRSTGPDPAAHELSIHHVSACEYWMLDHTAGTATTAVTMSWDNTSCGVNAPLELLVARWNGSLWVNEGNGGITGDAAAGTVSSSGEISSFSPFTLASTSGNNPLPVTWLSFTATAGETTVLLKWSTALELQNKGFAVERSADGALFQQVAFVDGNGNSSNVNYYSWIDHYPLPGKSYYRLKQIDINGQVKYSRTVAVEFVLANSWVRLMPNPAKEQTTLTLQLIRPEACTIILTDLAGRVIYSNQLGIVLYRTVNLDLTSYTAGVYLLTVKTPERVLYQNKIIKQ